MIETTAPHDSYPYRPKSLQLALAAPPALLWLLLAGISAIWWIGLVVNSVLGQLPVSDWRGPYLMAVCAFVLVAAVLDGVLFLRAAQGRSHLWWHAAMFATGLVFVGLMGIVGD